MGPDLTRVLELARVVNGADQGLVHVRQYREFDTVILADGNFGLSYEFAPQGPINGAMKCHQGGNSLGKAFGPLPLPRKLPHLDP